MTRYKKILPYFLVFAIAIIFLLVRIPFISSSQTRTVDSSKLILKILNFPFQEIKKILSYHSTYNRNLILKSENLSLKNKLVELEELRQENDRLKKLLNFKREAAASLVVAKIVSRDPSNWSSSVIIDKGSNYGIQENMCVVTELGLVGKVAEVGDSTSKIILINDPNSGVAALVQRSREQGIVSGTITGQLRFHFLPLNSDVKVSDMVITSGLGGIYPKGLIVGKVTEIGEEADGLSKSCLVKPAVRLSGIEEVLIITK